MRFYTRHLSGEETLILKEALELHMLKYGFSTTTGEEGNEIITANPAIMLNAHLEQNQFMLVFLEK